MSCPWLDDWILHFIWNHFWVTEMYFKIKIRQKVYCHSKKEGNFPFFSPFPGWKYTFYVLANLANFTCSASTTWCGDSAQSYRWEDVPQWPMMRNSSKQGWHTNCLHLQLVYCRYLNTPPYTLPHHKRILSPPMVYISGNLTIHTHHERKDLTLMVVRRRDDSLCYAAYLRAMDQTTCGYEPMGILWPVLVRCAISFESSTNDCR